MIVVVLGLTYLSASSGRLFFLLEEFLRNLFIIAPDYAENWMIIFSSFNRCCSVYKGGVTGSFHRLRLMASGRRTQNDLPYPRAERC